MKKISRILLYLALGLASNPLYAQNTDIITSKDYPQGYFRKALNIPADASGNFGELRSTHFHAGDDYRTQQRIGLPLHAAADGYVSRIRVQIGGGGNSVYITHPNGYTSVYLHMDHFNAALTKLVRAAQYKQKRFDVDLEVEPGTLTLKQGEYFGNAGNTGGSAGPHLHFEIRDSKTQHPLNPQLFGLRFTDNSYPSISSILVYDLNNTVFDEHTPRRPITVKAAGKGVYTLNQSAPIQVNGKFGLGINTIDHHRAGGFRQGVYSIELFIDNKPVSTVVFEELDYNTSGGILSYIDYPYWLTNKAKIQKSFKDPGNPIEIFRDLENNGVLTLNDNKVHEAKYVVKDVAGHSSSLSFKIQNTTATAKAAQKLRGVTLFAYKQDNNFQKPDLQLQMPKGVLYTDLDFQYSKAAQPKDGYSPVHRVHNKFTPLFSSYNLRIKPSNLPEHLHDKALIASLEHGSEGGWYENGWVTVNTKNFGNFYVTVDTVAPSITPRNLSNGKHIGNQKQLDFTIHDEFSGIQSFDGYIDGEWVLMEYDSKNRHLWHRLNPALSSGSHSFKLVVKDWKDNEKVYQAKFVK